MTTTWNPIKWEPNPNNAGVYICKTGETVFAIRDSVGNCLNKKGKLEYEPLPSNRSAAFLKRCRYASLEEAKTQYERWIAQ